MSDFWLYLESYTFLFESETSALILNTVSNQSCEIELNEVNRIIIQKLNNPTNVYCISLTESEFSNPEIGQFIYSLQRIFAGDVISQTISHKKPISLFPFINVKEDVKNILSKGPILGGEKLKMYVNEITIYLDSDCENHCESCSTGYKQTLFCRKGEGNLNPDQVIDFIEAFSNYHLNMINFIGGNVLNYPHLNRLITELWKYKKNIYIYINIRHINKFVEEMNTVNKLGCHVVILLNEIAMLKENTIELLNIAKNFRIIFIVTSISEKELVDHIVMTYNILDFEIVPFYLNNQDFFEEFVYLEREDILSMSHTMNSILRKKVLNEFDFGKLTVLADGSVFSNTNQNQLGRIGQPIHELLINEIEIGNSWFRIRSNKMCQGCIYQWLCPSPNNFEVMARKVNLCHIRHTDQICSSSNLGKFLE
ncbi:MAG: TIGR04150 pseudo-rSAM protein [Porphyromonadaceae bacterium]|nr:MAG: TIGR04150 pseudo-rSAM protein [Porphyromonadaceae bacterium]